MPGLRPTGFIGGGQLGYNWNAGGWVLGGEVDISGLSAKSDVTVISLFTGDPLIIGTGNQGTFSSQYDWLATARLRAGFLVASDWLLYATGGLAVAGVKDSATYSSTVTPERTSSQRTTLYGATFGGGVEYTLSRMWSVKLEYLHVMLNRTAPQIDLAISASPAYEFKHDLDIARVGVNYKFD